MWLVEQIDNLVEISDENSRVIVGITGAPGAGKSTLAKQLVANLNSRKTYLAAYAPMDGFHISNHQLRDLGKENRKGAPDTFDIYGYINLLRRVKEDLDHPIYLPDYSRILHQPIAGELIVDPEVKLVITEGNYLGIDLPGWREVRHKLDLLVYIDVKFEVLKQRLLERQIKNGKTVDQANKWFETVDKSNICLVQTTKSLADLVVSNFG